MTIPLPQNESLDQMEVFLYPNPIEGKLTIVTRSGLPQGLYILQLSSGNQVGPARDSTQPPDSLGTEVSILTFLKAM
jgi:hypothetical protein